MKRIYCLLLALLFGFPFPAPAVETPDSSYLLNQAGAAAADGQVDLEMDLKDGRVPLLKGYSLETEGKLRACLTAEADQGQVREMAVRGEIGRLVLRGKGILPDIAVESARVSNGLIVDARYHGFGLWRPILSLFRGAAMKRIRQIRFNTDLAKLMQGHLLKVDDTPAGEAPPPAPASAPAPPPAKKTGEPAPAEMVRQLLDLIDEVRIPRADLSLSEHATLEFRPYLRFETGTDPANHRFVSFQLRDAVFRPPQGGRPMYAAARGRIDGILGPGESQFGGNRASFSKGRLRGGSFYAATDAAGKIGATMSVDEFALSFTGGKFLAPGGVSIGLLPESELAVRNMKASSEGYLSGLLDFDLQGETGEWSRQGTRVALSNVRLVSRDLRVVERTATGDLAVDFVYRVDYPLIVKYPVPDMAPKKVDLEFKGPMSLRLKLVDVGMSDEGRVDGTYRFRVPWEPIQRGSFEVLKARWIQDFPALRKVSIDLDPHVFGPCGGTCFKTALTVTAEKTSEKTKKVWFRQICDPVGSANLVVDKEARAFALKDVKVETHCRGAVGWLINFVTPFLTKTYTDFALFRMPDHLPFTIDDVSGTETDLAIAGQVHWEQGTTLSKESK
jgi:hypothetical protein